MNKRGLGPIVATMLIILISVVGISLIWAAYKSFSGKSSADSLDCNTIDIRVTLCNYFQKNANLGGLIVEHNTIETVIERGPGEGDLRSVKIVGYDGNFNRIPLGINELDRPTKIDTDFTQLKEFTTKTAVNTGGHNDSIIRAATVAAVVGDSHAVCAPVKPVLVCQCYYASGTVEPCVPPNLAQGYIENLK